MKKKFEDAFKVSVKDFGLSDKATKELLESGLKTIADDATEEKVKAQVDLFVNIARAMQGEVTRKVQASQDQQKKDSKKEEKPDGHENQPAEPNDKGNDSELAKQLKAIQEQLANLEKANKEAAEEKAEIARKAIVKASAEKAGLGENILSLLDVSKVKTAEEADALFANVKQALVNEKLPKKGAGVGIGGNGSTEADKESAEAWAKTLPDKN